MSFSADWNSFGANRCHRNLLEVAFVGGVEWNKDFTLPEIVSHLIESGGIMSGIKTSLINGHALSGTVHGKTTGDTIVAAAGGHHQISGQFVSMGVINTGQLVKVVAVDIDISIGIVAN